MSLRPEERTPATPCLHDSCYSSMNWNKISLLNADVDPRRSGASRPSNQEVSHGANFANLHEGFASVCIFARDPENKVAFADLRAFANPLARPLQTFKKLSPGQVWGFRPTPIFSFHCRSTPLGLEKTGRLNALGSVSPCGRLGVFLQHLVPSYFEPPASATGMQALCILQHFVSDFDHVHEESQF